MTSCRLVNTFQKVTEHRKNLKNDPTFHDFLFEYEQSLCLDEKKKPSHIDIFLEYKKKSLQDEYPKPVSSKNIGREYARGMDTKSLLVLCDLKRNKLKLDNILDDFTTDSNTTSKLKVEKNLSMIKESLQMVNNMQQQQKKKKRSKNLLNKL